MSLCLLFTDPTPIGFMEAAVFSLVFAVLIDFDHVLNRDAPWFMKRTWIQEPTGYAIIGFPLALLLGVLDKTFTPLTLASYGSHILLDYLCVFEARPFAPFLDVRKREGLGIFIPDDFFHSSPNSRRWRERVKAMGIKGVSENYFTPFALLLLFIVLCVKLSCLT